MENTDTNQAPHTSTFSRIVGFITKRTLVTDIVQGIIVGAVLAYITTTLLITHEASAIQTTTFNGWSATMQCGEPGNGILLQAACAKILPAANVIQEAAYWTTTVDSTGQTLNGQHDYVLHFPKGQLPPNHAFWSLTLTDVSGHMVPNSANRYSISDRSGLAQNADGSINIYLQNTAPADHESNWLPAPTGDFKLWLRAYLPDPNILSEYQVPPVTPTQ